MKQNILTQAFKNDSDSIVILMTNNIRNNDFEFLKMCVQEGIDYIEYAEQMKWQEFEFYCRYGYFR